MLCDTAAGGPEPWVRCAGSYRPGDAARRVIDIATLGEKKWPASDGHASSDGSLSSILWTQEMLPLPILERAPDMARQSSSSGIKGPIKQPPRPLTRLATLLVLADRGGAAGSIPGDLHDVIGPFASAPLQGAGEGPTTEGLHAWGLGAGAVALKGGGRACDDRRIGNIAAMVRCWS